MRIYVTALILLITLGCNTVPEVEPVKIEYWTPQDHAVVMKQCRKMCTPKVVHSYSLEEKECRCSGAESK